MGDLLEFVTPLHLKTKRDYLARMQDEKVTCMEVARRFSRDFWDGDRRYGYGGYHYDGRWAAVADKLVTHYQLPSNARILDVGCGKGFLLHELKNMLPEAEIQGIDISSYAIDEAHPSVASDLFVHDARETLPFSDQAFDLVISINTLHNFSLGEASHALSELQRVAKNAYLLVEGYRNPQELFNLQCWALTCESFFKPEEWVWLFQQSNYQGDYEFIFFE